MRNSLHQFVMREAASTGAPKFKPTAPQMRELRRGLDEDGLIRRPVFGNGFRKAYWERMMERLRSEGHVTPYLDGDYYLTDIGRQAAEKSV